MRIVIQNSEDGRFFIASANVAEAPGGKIVKVGKTKEEAIGKIALVLIRNDLLGWKLINSRLKFKS